MVTTFNESQLVGFAVVEEAVIRNVNSRLRTVDVTTTHSNRVIDDVKLASPGLSNYPFGGAVYLPNPDDVCWICTPADKSGSFVFAYGTIAGPARADVPDSEEEGPSYRADAPDQVPGEWVFATRDGNFVRILRGGMIQVGATDLSCTSWIPINNTIRTIFQRFEAKSPLGEIIWDHAELLDGDRVSADAETTPVLLKLGFRSVAQNANYTVSMAIGSITDQMIDSAAGDSEIGVGAQSAEVGGQTAEVDSPEDGTVDAYRHHLFGALKVHEGQGMGSYGPDGGPVGALSISVSSSDGSKSWLFQVSEDGDVFMRARSHVHLEVSGPIYIKSEDAKGVMLEGPDGAYVSIGEYIELSVGRALNKVLLRASPEGDLAITARNLTLAATGTLTLSGANVSMSGVPGGGSSEVTLDCNRLNLGEGADTPLIVGDEAGLETLATHQHTSAAVGSPTTPIAGAPPLGSISPAQGLQTTRTTRVQVFIRTKE